MTEDTDTEIDRRSFLKQSAVGAFGVGGFATQDGQNGDGQDGDGQTEGDGPVYVRRMVFPYPERIDGDIRRKIILMTDRTDQDPDELRGVNESAVNNCNFSDPWPPEDLNIWEGILVDWKNVGGLVGFYGRNPTVRATQLVERNTIFVEAQQTDIPLGTPFIANRVTQCPDDLIGIEASKLPGIDIKTGPGVSTGEGTNDLPDQFR